MNIKDETNDEIKNKKEDGSKILKEDTNEYQVLKETDEVVDTLLSKEKPAEQEDEDESASEEKSKEQLQHEEIEQLRDEKLRLLAEMDNLRKRSDRDRADSIRYGSINLARDILSPDDNLTRALDAIPDKEKSSETVNNLIDGLRMVQREFSTILEKHGVKKIDALKNKFDHNFHQAMVEIEDDEAEPGIVVQEMQSGYTMYDRLLRPSMVGVSKKTSKTDIETD